jgi:hypothetical protein
MTAQWSNPASSPAKEGDQAISTEIAEPSWAKGNYACWEQDFRIDSKARAS